MKFSAFFRFACTALVLGAAILLTKELWNRYMNTPWTRDGRVRADVIKVAADVSGMVVQVAVRDNQQVRRGDLLFVVDRERYRLALQKARAELAARKAELAMRQQEAQRRAELENVAVSVESYENAKSQAETAAARYDEAAVAAQTAQLNLRRTEVRSPVDGFITNLGVHAGDFASAGDAKLAVIDRRSFAVYGYFEETKLHLLHQGDFVEVRFLGSAPPARGHIESLAHGISDRDNPTSRELLSEVNPVFNWVRLAQRVPVRVRLEAVPPEVRLAAGMTCTVIVRQEQPDPKQGTRRL